MSCCHYAGMADDVPSDPTRISMPDFVDWHMILDRELDQLSRPENSILASLGFVALGAFLGLIGPTVAAYQKVWAVPTLPLTKGDFVNLCLFVFCGVAATIWLSIAGLAWWRNRGLAGEIRKRPKQGAVSTGETAAQTAWRS
jgi:hypothetical protein